ncbi:hypothetical protein [Streptacidiphilus jiangxiensis]|nr:hypothetical protein [Streptacidiphilus jiangxiensis]
MPAPGGMPQAAPKRADGASLVAAMGGAAALVLELLLMLVCLVSSHNVGTYLASLFGLADNLPDVWAPFSSWDVAMCGTLAAGVIGSFGGRTWGRPVILAMMAMIAYPDTTMLLDSLRTAAGRAGFGQGHNLWIYLVIIAEVLVALGTFVAVLLAAARNGGTRRPAPAGMAAPMMQPGVGPMPAGQPGQPYPPQPQPPVPGYPQQVQPQQLGYGYPQQPGQPYPGQQPQAPVPPQGQPQPGPQAGQQPTPTQEAMSYRPTEFAPPPGQPAAQPYPAQSQPYPGQQPGQPYPGQQPQAPVPPQGQPQPGPQAGQQPTPTQEAMSYRPTEFAPPPGQRPPAQPGS